MGDDLQVYLLPDAPFFSVMTAECTDIATVEELRHFSLWVENGSAVEQFMGILPLKEGNAELFYIDGSRRSMYNVTSLLAWVLMVQQCLRKMNWSSSMTEDECTTCYLHPLPLP